MAEQPKTDFNSPQNLLVHFLGEADKYKGVVVVAIEKSTETKGESLVVGNSALPLHEIIGALYAAAGMKEVDFQNEYLQGEDENGDETPNV